MNTKLEKQNITFVRRVSANDYLEDQTVTIPEGGGAQDVTGLLIGADLFGYECLIDERRVILLGFEPKN